MKFNEDTRYVVYRLGAHIAWWSAAAWTAVLTWVNLSRPVTALPSTFQRISGLFIILLMGVAIALGSALARMRLARTITKVFEAGVTVALIEESRRHLVAVEVEDEEEMKR